MPLGAKKSCSEVKVAKAPLLACLTCPLCGQLVHEATTICECLHTFCRACIINKLSDGEVTGCPMCNVSLGCAPLEKLRSDALLDDVKAKLFPESAGVGGAGGVRKRKISSGGGDGGGGGGGPGGGAAAAAAAAAAAQQAGRRKERSLYSLGIGTVPSNPGFASRKTKWAAASSSSAEESSSDEEEEEEEEEEESSGESGRAGDEEEEDGVEGGFEDAEELEEDVLRRERERERKRRRKMGPPREDGGGARSVPAAAAAVAGGVGDGDDEAAAAAAAMDHTAAPGRWPDGMDPDRAACALNALVEAAQRYQQARSASTGGASIPPATDVFSHPSRPSKPASTAGGGSSSYLNGGGGGSGPRTTSTSGIHRRRSTGHGGWLSSSSGGGGGGTGGSSHHHRRPHKTPSTSLAAQPPIPPASTAVPHGTVSCRRNLGGLWFALEAAPGPPGGDPTGGGPLPQITRRYLRIRDERLPVSMVKKYLVKKLGLKTDAEVEIRCRGQPVVPSLPLDTIRSIWFACKDRDASGRVCFSGEAHDYVMVLTYQRHRRPRIP